MKWRAPTEASFEKVRFVVFDTPNIAVVIGTVVGVQLAAVFQSPDPGLRIQVASCPSAATMPSHRPASSIRNV